MLAEPQFSVAVLFVLVPHVWAESARQMLPATIAREQVGTKAGSAQIVQPPRVAEESDNQVMVLDAAIWTPLGPLEPS
jgi:hypothetical protein